jgi:predicted enzyme related to lactoylglutathione lyase
LQFGGELRLDHTVVHFEIPANDVEKLRKFYENVLGWKITKTPMPEVEYWNIFTVPTDEKGMLQRPGVNGGLYPRTPEMPAAPQVNYISVENIDKYTDLVTKEGGKILVPKKQIPRVGWFAIVADPEGNAFGLLQPEMPPRKP